MGSTSALTIPLVSLNDPAALIAFSYLNTNSCASISLFEACVPKLLRFSKMRMNLPLCLPYDREHEIQLPMKGDFLNLVMIYLFFDAIEPADSHHHRHSKRHQHKSSKHSSRGRVAVPHDSRALHAVPRMKLKTPQETLAECCATSMLFHSELACNPADVLDEIGQYFCPSQGEEYGRHTQRCRLIVDMWCFRGEPSQALALMNMKLSPPSLQLHVRPHSATCGVNDKHGKLTNEKAQPARKNSEDDDDDDDADSRPCQKYYTIGSHRRRFGDLRMQLVLEYFQIHKSERDSRKHQEYEWISFRTQATEMTPTLLRYKNMEHSFEFSASGLVRICYVLTQPRSRVSKPGKTLNFAAVHGNHQPIRQIVARIDQYELETLTPANACYFVYDSNKSVNKQRYNGLVFVVLNPSVNLCSNAPQGGFYTGLIDKLSLTIQFNKFPGGKYGEQNVCIYTESYELIVVYGHAMFVFGNGIGRDGY